MSYEENDRNAVIETRACIEPNCGRKFEITAGEEQFLKERGCVLPKRCKTCRQKRKVARGS